MFTGDQLGDRNGLRDRGPPAPMVPAQLWCRRGQPPQRLLQAGRPGESLRRQPAGFHQRGQVHSFRPGLQPYHIPHDISAIEVGTWLAIRCTLNRPVALLVEGSGGDLIGRRRPGRHTLNGICALAAGRTYGRLVDSGGHHPGGTLSRRSHRSASRSGRPCRKLKPSRTVSLWGRYWGGVRR